MDDDPLGEITRRSDVLTAARLGASYTNFFKTLLKQAWEKAMLVGLPCVLEEKVYGTILRTVHRSLAMVAR